VPVLYVDGAESGLRLDPRIARGAAGGPASRAGATVDGAGHHPHVERPDAFADLVIRFLADGLRCVSAPTGVASAMRREALRRAANRPGTRDRPAELAWPL
jgi:hypothetical protein